MKWVKGILVLGLMLQALGCSLDSTDDGLKSVTAQRNARGGVNSGTMPPPTGALWGRVTSQDSNYNAVLKSLVYVDGNEPFLGMVDPTGQTTGVFFWGSFVTSNGITFNNSTAGNYFASLASNTSQVTMNIEIWDEYAGKEYQGYGVLLPYTFTFGKTSSGYRGSIGFAYAQNGAMLIRLSDQYGELVFNAGYEQTSQPNPYGNGIVGNSILGTVHYKNKNPKTFPGQAISTGGYTKVGNFEVPLCGFFKCQ